MILYTDYVGGSNLNGGSSFAVLASGVDGVTAAGGSNFSSASAPFTSGMVGHVLARVYAGYVYYTKISAFVDASNVTLSDYSGTAATTSADTAISFKVGGRWKVFSDEGITPYADPSIITTLADDEFREIASPYPNSLGDAQWTDSSRLVTFSVPVAATVHDCDSAWTAANSSTVSAATFRRLGAASSRCVFPTTRIVNTKYFYKTLDAPLDLSAWQRICFWMYRVNGTMTGMATTRLCLCSDTTGDVIVVEAVMPACPITAGWYPQTMDFGAALPASVQSIAIYTGATIPNTTLEFYLNNMIAVKPAGDALEFTLATLIGKVHNSYWQATHAYASGAIRKPTPPNRNGFRYQITTAGTSGATEPAWPQAVSATVTDGSAVWTCEGLEDTWYPCLSLANGTTFTVDNGNTLTTISTTELDYLQTETESVETFGRGVTDLRYTSSGDSWFSYPEGTAETRGKSSGGWNRTDMSVKDGETWMDGGILKNDVLYFDGGNTDYDNLNVVRGYAGITLTGAGNSRITNCHAVGCVDGYDHISALGWRIEGGVANRNSAAGARGITTATPQQTSVVSFNRFRADGNRETGIQIVGHMHDTLWARKNGYKGTGPQSGVAIVNYAAGPVIIRGLKTSGNAQNGVGFSNSYDLPAPDVYLVNASLGETTPIHVISGPSGNRIVCQNFNGVAGDSRTYVAGGIMEATSTGRHTASGVAWKVTLTPGQYRHQYLPLIVPFKLAVGAEAMTVGLYVKRMQLAAAARLVCVGGIVAGIPVDVVSQASAAVDTYEQLTVAVTPTQAGVLLLELHVYPHWRDVDLYDYTPVVVYFDDISVA